MMAPADDQRPFNVLNSTGSGDGEGKSRSAEHLVALVCAAQVFVQIAVIGYGLVAAMAGLRRWLLAWHQEAQEGASV